MSESTDDACGLKASMRTGKWANSGTSWGWRTPKAWGMMANEASFGWNGGGMTAGAIPLHSEDASEEPEAGDESSKVSTSKVSTSKVSRGASPPAPLPSPPPCT